MSVLSKKDGRRGALRVHLVGRGEETRLAVRTALAALIDPALDIKETEPDLTAVTDGSTDVTMVVFNGDQELELNYLSSQSAVESRPVLFALLHDRSPELMKRVLRAGADELLFLPLDPGETTRALLKISETRRREEVDEGGTIISLVSLIGGTGVTSLSANLALALRYAFNKRVAVVDLDLQTGGLSVFLNLEPERTIMALTNEDRKLDSIQLESALSKHTSGIYLLAAPKKIEDSELVSDTTVGAILNLMRQLFDFVIVDCGTHIDANTVAAWERSQHLFYVLDQSIGAARCAWRFVDLCGRLGLSNIEPNFILSRFVPGHPISEDQLSHTLAKSLYAKIPRDEKVLERIQLSAQDLWQVAPNSPLAKCVEELARRLEMGAEMAHENSNSLVSRLLNAIGARA
ncbi:MAG: AAA family ATPase [Candidatus Binatus sp.]|uniref:AAA family ATPase n=1 Tax=Candidatus Binatus sp. TaxID=2811406 RepID=UPI002729004B|nr:AAA family ATPase [Candidatus Binatus sp.]MDO8431818.1 AAA family ATPase [Candidatus Binatus sp.]